MEEKWLRIWEEKRVFEADPIEGKPKVFVTFPFPYMNGPLHLGHGFTSTRVDVYARFKRMQGYNVLFPWAWHWSGQPIVAAAERLRRGDPAMLREFKEIDRVPEDEIERFIDPVYMATYYTNQSREAVRRLGHSIDWRREFRTTSLEPTFSKFIEWQYYRLRERGYVAKGTHPVVWCPHDQSPTGDHDRLEGEGVTWEEYTLIKFRMDGSYLPAATFRPETIYGVTNLWINPDAVYVNAKVDGERWMVSKEAAIKLGEQKRHVQVESEFQGRVIIGKKCVEPINNRSILILPASFVDSQNGSGVVYSVPAHAPIDYVALRDLQQKSLELKNFGIDVKQVSEIKPISLIAVEGFGDYPAIEAVESLRVKDQRDPKVDEATRLVYKKEFHTGTLKGICGQYAGKKVSEAKALLIEAFREKRIADSMYDLPQRVVCRCTTRCIVKVLEGQWFLRYSDRAWKEKTIQMLNKARIYPEEAKKWFADVIEWYRDWPCARRTGLGTPLMWSEGWIVETLSDSTVYNAFYTISKHIKTRRISPESLLPEVFDYVFFGKGDATQVSRLSGIERSLLEEMRQEFLYWYPVDLRHSAKELLPNHLTFFLFHHSALFPEELWPRAVGVNGMMMLEGQKMSKSKGNVIPLKIAIDRFGADAVRATLVSSADGMDDADWRDKNAEDFGSKLKAIMSFVTEGINDSVGGSRGNPERWLLSTFQRRIQSITESLEELRIRSAFQVAFFDVWNDVKSYLKKVQRAERMTITQIFRDWARLLSSFVPYAAEEINEMIGGRELVCVSDWPKPRSELIDESAELAEWLIVEFIEDVRNVLKLFQPEKKLLHAYVAPKWQASLLHGIAQAKTHGSEANDVLKADLNKPENAAIRGQIASVFKKLLVLANDLGSDVITKIATVGPPDEYLVLQNAQHTIRKELGLELRVYHSDSQAVYDPKQKARTALLTRPAFYIQ